MIRPKQKVGFALLGGIHHILHLIPPAAEMADHPDLEPVIFTRTREEASMCEDVITKLGASNITIRLLQARPRKLKIGEKLTPLLSNIKLLQELDAIVFAERTSTFLKHLPLRLPPFIHIPHGAGDRAKSYDKRIRLFDYVIVAGPKDKRRMIERNLVTNDSCSISGYIKAAALKRIYPDRKPLFSDQKPVVLYNPHFDKHLSSWPKFGHKILEVFSNQSEFNFVFAPHIRLFANGPKRIRQDLENYARRKNIIVDLGSEHSTDMTYTRAADLYIGDVSSQVYEFLLTPKPCLFLAHEKFDWKENPDYSHWAFGPVKNDSHNLLQSSKNAIKTHSQFKDIQISSRNQALGNPDEDALANCVNIISEILSNHTAKT